MEPTLEILLHQYRMYLVNRVVTCVFGRIVFVGILVLMFFQMKSQWVISIAIFVASPVGTFWFFEDRVLARRLAWLGEIIGRHSKDMWEDTYIKSRSDYYVSYIGDKVGRVVLKMEPLLWILLADLVAVLKVGT